MKKAAILILAFAYFLPIVTAFCCCVELPSFAPSHNHSSSQHHHSEKSEHNDSHNPSDCNHPQIIGNLASRTDASFVSLASSMIQQLNFLLAEKAVSTTDHVSHAKTINDTGPPGHSLSIPLYLQISVLRI